ncbi:FG-GAP repeat domain-containing protein [Clostridium cellulovorans]|uniref:FG-GAP repeat protein n=1 Tax=Clostridium cellulovorans (strain ATCC 35296 / DSM 3052 / OCM 3 / 743B) TaxID=573061 RepID=D9SNR0_CLOC7|nr:FG-GAP-like repeat-containing protein [Clostridium cellulovorans]ADL49931.1 hypothetical protein Clocel_0142 [Clostridium cellulovorans 743B]
MKNLRIVSYLTTALVLGGAIFPAVTAKNVQAATKTISYISTKPLSASKADVTGDGKADYVAVWNNSGKRNIATYVAKGDGTFNELINTVSSGNFTSDAVGRDTGIFADVTGDGKADYIVSWNNNGKRTLATYVAKGDGTFNEYVNTFSAGTFTADTMESDTGTFTDVNGDRKADYVVTWNNSGKRSFTTYLAKGDGTFNEFINTASSGSFTADTVGRDTGIFTDVTGDGKTDYVVTWNNNGKRSFTTYVAKGDGTFNEFVNTSSGGTFMLDTLGRDTGIFADVTGDGKADYIVPWNNNGKRSFATYVGKADGTFNELVSSSSTGTFTADSIGRDTGTFTDVTGDGKVDYVVSWNNSGKRSFATYVGKADGTFNELVSSSSAGTFTADSMGKDVGIFTDVTGDGRADYVVPWNNNGKRSFATYVGKADGKFNELVTTSSNGTFLADKVGRDLGVLAGDRDSSINDTRVFVEQITLADTISPNSGTGFLYKYEAELISKINFINYNKFGTELDTIKSIYINNKSTYDNIASKTNIPSALICALHYRESGCNFGTYLHNGQPLGQITTKVPVGLYFTDFASAAIDALTRKSDIRDDYGLKSSSVDMAAMAGFAEQYNGTGYHDYHSMPSPYVFNGTNVYTSGKYTSDGNFNQYVIDVQPGVYIILKKLMG